MTEDAVSAVVNVLGMDTQNSEIRTSLRFGQVHCAYLLA